MHILCTDRSLHCNAWCSMHHVKVRIKIRLGRSWRESAFCMSIRLRIFLVCYCCCFYRRKKRDTSSADERVEDALPANAIDPNEEGEVPGPEGLHPNATWPTPSNITLELATNSCVTPIQSLAIYNVCAEYTALTSPAIVDSCILDIQVHRPCFLYMPLHGNNPHTFAARGFLT